jgi:enoyl-CoA hydratase/carnithine racemase
MPDEVAVVSKGPVTIVTLQNERRLNALSGLMRKQLEEALTRITQDGECRAVVLTGAGTNFSAGGDVSEMRWRSNEEGRARMEVAHRIVRLLSCGSKPVVSAVEGNAVGGGMSLALACDYVVAAENARFSASFIPRVALLPDMALMWNLSQRVGLGLAKRMLITGTALSGRDAVAVGVADQEVPAGSALAAALEVATQFAELPAKAVHFLKLTLANRNSTLEETLRAEADYQSQLFQSDDHAEAARAFIQKRHPIFRGELPPT